MIDGACLASDQNNSQRSGNGNKVLPGVQSNYTQNGSYTSQPPNDGRNTDSSSSTDNKNALNRSDGSQKAANFSQNIQ